MRSATRPMECGISGTCQIKCSFVTSSFAPRGLLQSSSKSAWGLEEVLRPGPDALTLITDSKAPNLWDDDVHLTPDGTWDYARIEAELLMAFRANLPQDLLVRDCLVRQPIQSIEIHTA